MTTNDLHAVLAAREALRAVVDRHDREIQRASDVAAQYRLRLEAATEATRTATIDNAVEREQARRDAQALSEAAEREVAARQSEAEPGRRELEAAERDVASAADAVLDEEAEAIIERANYHLAKFVRLALLVRYYRPHRYWPNDLNTPLNAVRPIRPKEDRVFDALRKLERLTEAEELATPIGRLPGPAATWIPLPQSNVFAKRRAQLIASGVADDLPDLAAAPSEAQQNAA